MCPQKKAESNAHARPANVFGLKDLIADRRLRSRTECWRSPTPVASGSGKALIGGRFPVLAHGATRIMQDVRYRKVTTRPLTRSAHRLP